MIIIKDYDSKYNDEIDKLDEYYWSDNEIQKPSISSDIKETDIFKMALDRGF